MNFGKTLLATMLGTFISFIVLCIIGFVIIIGMVAAATADEEVTLTKESILVLDLSKPIADRSPATPWFLQPGASGPVLGLDEIIRNIEKAKTDNHIVGIYLHTESVDAALPTIQQIRKAIAGFRTSGKFVISYGNNYSQGAWLLATEADIIALNPEGGLTLKGLSARMPFFKGTLSKLGVDVQIIRYGKFKAATEPLFLDHMSNENRTQISRILSVMWNETLDAVNQRRHIEPAVINQLADDLTIRSAKDACDYHLVDTLLYKDQLLDLLKHKAAIDSAGKLTFVSLDQYNKVKGDRSTAKEQIAVVFAEGDIVDGEGEEDNIGGERISRVIRKARENKKIKAVVLRVNSGGGSALASEVIWREVTLTAKEKPVIASFGDVAASGGYYIACGAHKILAESATITGSIGVWAAIPNLKNLMNEKLGVTFDQVATNKNSGFPDVMEPLTPYQLNTLQQEVDQIYITFANRVATGRNLTFEQVDSIGQGRIWAGKDALALNLVDSLAGLQAAIEMAARMANLTDYRISNLPEQKDPIDQFIEELMGRSAPDVLMREALGSDYPLYRQLQTLRELKGIQARLPFPVTIK